MKKVEELLAQKTKKLENNRNEYLLDNELVKKVTSKTKKDDYIYYDEEKGVYYKYEPINITDKELKQSLELDSNIIRLKGESGYAGLFRGLAIFVFIMGLITGVVTASINGSFMSFIVSIYNFGITGFLFLGISQIIKLLEEIRKK